MTRGLILLLAAMALVLPASAAAKAPSPAKQARSAFKLMIADTRHVPKRAVSRRNRAKLVRAAKRARKFSKRRPCRALKGLRTYNKLLKRVKNPKVKGNIPGPPSYRGRLRSDLLRTRIALLQSPRAKKCGGGKHSTVSRAQVKVLGSSNRQLKLRLKLPPPKFVAQQVGKKEFQQLLMTGMGETGAVGKPGLPTSGKFFGVPVGAGVQVKIGKKQGYTIPGVNLYPHQVPPVDASSQGPQPPPRAVFANKPFTQNKKAYRSKHGFPKSVAGGGADGMLRDVRIGHVSFTGGVYTAKRKKLHVFTSIDVTLNFTGGTGKFGNAQDVLDPWNARFFQSYRSQLTNFSTVASNLGSVNRRPFCGEEMLIVTSPALEPAANTLATHRQAAGISTRVVLTGPSPAGIGTTNTQIQSYIRGQLTNPKCLVHPTYVVLLGNTAQVPTFLVECAPGAGFHPDPAHPENYCDIASDLPYSLNGIGSDLFADTMLGRIPAPDLATANTVVNKIVNYEDSMPAPPGDDFYSHATVTGYWQPYLKCVLNEGAVGPQNCNENIGAVNGHYEIDYDNHQEERGFTGTSDKMIRAMQFNSYDVDRLWTTDNENVIPERYFDGTAIPTALRRPAFGWNADTTDFLNAYNGGRFLIMHRDHGWPDGWAAPELNSNHVPLMTNGTKLPVVFGVNCASAAFDTPDHPSFVELQLQKAGGGAVAGFGDTRVSPTWPNNDMALGFFDALFPNTIPSFGSSTPSRRLGDVLLSGKSYMASVWDGGGEYVEHYLYHLLGDPSMQMWAATPQHFNIPKIVLEYKTIQNPKPGDPPFEILASFPTGAGNPPPAGTILTLFSSLRGQNRAIGRAVVGPNGQATIVPNANASRKGLEVSFEQIGALPGQKAVQ